MSKFIVYTLMGRHQDDPSRTILMPVGADRELREAVLTQHAADMEEAGFKATAIFEDMPMPCLSSDNSDGTWFEISNKTSSEWENE